MSPSPRAALALLIVAIGALVVPVPIALAAAAVVALVTVVDMVLARRRPRVRRIVPGTLARGVPAQLVLETIADEGAAAGRVALRQPRPPDFTIEPNTGWGRVEARVVAHRRGAHRLPPVAARRYGPLRLGACTFDAAGDSALLVYPDVDMS